MGKKTINQALKDLFLGLGGDSSALADNSSVSDYIEDLESAIKGAASGAQIDDETASTTTVYSGSKTEELINGIETLPSVAVGDIGKVLTVVSDGEGGATWEESTPNIPVYVSAVGTGSNNVVLGKTSSEIASLIDNRTDVFLVYQAFEGDNSPWTLRFACKSGSNYIFSAVSFLNANLRARFVTVATNQEKASQKDIDITPTT